MARLTDTLIGERAFAKDANSPMLNLSYGGQHGWAPNLGELVNNQAYIRRNLHCVLLEAPKFFSVMPNPELWVQCLKALVEIHPRTIEGLKAGLTVETDTHAVGGAGELQDECTNVTRERSEPSFTWIEKYGRPTQTFLQHWITYGLMDPDTKYSLAVTLAGDQRPKDILLDWYSMSCLFFEPDPSHTSIVQSWVTTNMYPKSIGDIIGKKDKTSASEILELNIEFTGVSQYSLGTNIFAQKILDSINMVNSNPFLRPSFIQDISSDVAAAKEGLIKNITDLGNSAVPGIQR